MECYKEWCKREGKGVRVLYVTNSLWHSAFTLFLEFSCWTLMLFVNYHYLGNSGWVNFTICVVFILMASATSSIKRMSKEEAMKFFSDMQKEESEKD